MPSDICCAVHTGPALPEASRFKPAIAGQGAGAYMAAARCAGVMPGLSQSCGRPASRQAGPGCAPGRGRRSRRPAPGRSCCARSAGRRACASRRRRAAARRRARAAWGARRALRRPRRRRRPARCPGRRPPALSLARTQFRRLSDPGSAAPEAAWRGGASRLRSHRPRHTQAPVYPPRILVLRARLGTSCRTALRGCQG